MWRNRLTHADTETTDVKALIVFVIAVSLVLLNGVTITTGVACHSIELSPVYCVASLCVELSVDIRRL